MVSLLLFLLHALAATPDASLPPERGPVPTRRHLQVLSAEALVDLLMAEPRPRVRAHVAQWIRLRGDARALPTAITVCRWDPDTCGEVWPLLNTDQPEVRPTLLAVATDPAMPADRRANAYMRLDAEDREAVWRVVWPVDPLPKALVMRRVEALEHAGEHQAAATLLTAVARRDVDRSWMREATRRALRLQARRDLPMPGDYAVAAPTTSLPGLPGDGEDPLTSLDAWRAAPPRLDTLDGVRHRAVYARGTVHMGGPVRIGVGAGLLVLSAGAITGSVFAAGEIGGPTDTPFWDGVQDLFVDVPATIGLVTVATGSLVTGSLFLGTGARRKRGWVKQPFGTTRVGFTPAPGGGALAWGGRF